MPLVIFPLLNRNFKRIDICLLSGLFINPVSFVSPWTSRCVIRLNKRFDFFFDFIKEGPDCFRIAAGKLISTDKPGNGIEVISDNYSYLPATVKSSG